METGSSALDASTCRKFKFSNFNIKFIYSYFPLKHLLFWILYSSYIKLALRIAAKFSALAGEAQQTSPANMDKIHQGKLWQNTRPRSSRTLGIRSIILLTSSCRIHMLKVPPTLIKIYYPMVWNSTRSTFIFVW